MKWILLDSSVLRAARYVEEQELLDLEFRSGAIYRYFEFPADRYRALLSAESQGQYFNRYIVGHFLHRWPFSGGETASAKSHTTLKATIHRPFQNRLTTPTKY